MCCVPSLIVWLFSNYGSGRRTRYHLCQRGAAPPAPGPGPGTTLTKPSQPMRHKHKIISTTSIWTAHRQKANKKEKAHTQRMLVLRSKLSVCFALHFSSTCDLLHWDRRWFANLMTGIFWSIFSCISLRPRKPRSHWPPSPPLNLPSVFPTDAASREQSPINPAPDSIVKLIGRGNPYANFSKKLSIYWHILWLSLVAITKYCRELQLL